MYDVFDKFIQNLSSLKANRNLCAGDIGVSGDSDRHHGGAAVLVSSLLQPGGARSDRHRDHQLLRLRLVQRVRPGEVCSSTMRRHEENICNSLFVGQHVDEHGRSQSAPLIGYFVS